MEAGNLHSDSHTGAISTCNGAVSQPFSALFHSTGDEDELGTQDLVAASLEPDGSFT